MKKGTMPLITITVPIYNVEPYLRRCVDSILAQTFTDFELVLVDDGSPDNCGAICDEYAKKEARVHVIHQEHSGPATARNAGIDWAFANSDSKWLAFVDSDDWVHPEYLASLLRAVTEDGTKISACRYRECSKQDPFQPEKYHSEVMKWEDFYIKQRVSATIPVNKLYEKELFRDFRYPDGKIHEDEYLTYKVMNLGGKISCLSGVLYFYYKNRDSITKSKYNLQRVDCVGAFREQVEFASTHGNEDLFRLCSGIYLKNILFNANNIKKADDLPKDECEVILKDLKKEMRKGLFRYGMRFYKPSDIPEYYKFAFPKLAKVRGSCYRVQKKWMKKIKKKKKALLKKNA